MFSKFWKKEKRRFLVEILFKKKINLTDDRFDPPDRRKLPDRRNDDRRPS